MTGKTQNGPFSICYYDGLNRPIAEDRQGFDDSTNTSGTTVRVATQYDALGRVAQTSRPYFVSTGTPVFTAITYDPLGRVVTKTFPDGSKSQYAYHGLTTNVTNSLNQTTTTVMNSQGEVVQVTDALGKVTTYAYDPFANLVKITDALGNVTSYTYDTRGRKTAASDPDLGAWSFAYDTLSELVSQTDAKGQVTTLQYDKLSRVTERVEPDMTSVWAYDTAAMGVGKLASATITAGPSNGYQRVHSYDSLGRPSQVAITFGGATYTLSTPTTPTAGSARRHTPRASRSATATRPWAISTSSATPARGRFTGRSTPMMRRAISCSRRRGMGSSPTRASTPIPGG